MADHADPLRVDLRAGLQHIDTAHVVDDAFHRPADIIIRGEIVILEDWRLRRTFATILGADLADEEDPLLAGLAVSGNSYVGDTLFLGDENRKEFLALFKADLKKKKTEQAAVQGLFDDLAHRVTVLVHQEFEPQDLGLIRRVVDLETPAHIIFRVMPASRSFLVGMASLVGIDTYLAEDQGPQSVTVERSHIGLRDIIRRPASLDPRLEGCRSDLMQTMLQIPIANAGPDRIAELGKSFRLDGSLSEAAKERRVVRYIWTMVE